MTPPLLEVRNLHTYLQSGGEEVRAVDDVSFTIPKGEHNIKIFSAQKMTSKSQIPSSALSRSFSFFQNLFFYGISYFFA